MTLNQSPVGFFSYIFFAGLHLWTEWGMSKWPILPQDIHLIWGSTGEGSASKDLHVALGSIRSSHASDPRTSLSWLYCPSHSIAPCESMAAASFYVTGCGFGNSRRLFLTNCYFWTAVKSRRSSSVSCCFPGFPRKADTVCLCIRICPIPSLALWSTFSVSVIFISLTLLQRQGPAYSGPTLCCHAFLLSLLFSVHCPSRPR